MTIKIHNVITFLELISTLKIENKANSKNVEKNFELRGIEKGSNYSFPEEVREFCELSSLIKLENENYTITELGKQLLENSMSLDTQRNFLILNCIMDGEFSKIILPIIYNFNSDTGSYWCEMSDVEEHFKNYSKFLGLLYELNFLVKNYNYRTVEVNSKITNTSIFQKQIQKTIRIPLSKQEENRKKKEEENKITGQIAEDIVVEFERERLAHDEHFEESKKVQQISVDFSNAGYDIESFAGKAGDLDIFDKFIEVKGTTTDEFRFFWSKNEIKQARKLGKQYWIYFVAKINKNDRTGKIIEMIQDPFTMIDPLNYFDKYEYHKECESYKITKRKEN